MPFGEFQYSVDDKGRVILPPSFRHFVQNGMVVTRGMEGCLYVYPRTDWDKIVEQLEDLPLTDAEARNFVRFFYSGAAEANADGNGRITLPQTLRNFAGIDATNNSVVIAGAPKRLEIWNEAKWLSNLMEIQNQPPVPGILRELAG